MNKPLVEIKKLTAGYEDNIVLRNVSLNIYPKDFLGIIGPNGGGKTTLVKVILGLIKPVSGDIFFSFPKNRIGYMPQTNYIDKRFPISVMEVIESGLTSEKRLDKKEKQTRVDTILHEMGIEEISRRPIGELSGGQLQRVLLARAIIKNPQLLILDEPSSYVDKRFESHFYKLLKQINENTAIILVSHDIGTTLSMIKNIACINETLHYHSGTEINGEWLEEHFECPLEVIGHGDIPHRILKKH